MNTAHTLKHTDRHQERATGREREREREKQTPVKSAHATLALDGIQSIEKTRVLSGAIHLKLCLRNVERVHGSRAWCVFVVVFVFVCLCTYVCTRICVDVRFCMRGKERQRGESAVEAWVHRVRVCTREFVCVHTQTFPDIRTQICAMLEIDQAKAVWRDCTQFKHTRGQPTQ